MMKKSLLALAALSVYASSASVSAAEAGNPLSSTSDSSVALYGVVDASASFVTDVQVEKADGWNGRRGKQLYGMSGTGLQQSRFGLRIIENIGNGVSAVAVLEGGVDYQNGRSGQGGRLFGRQAFVGLSVADAGTVTIGRQSDTLGDFVGLLQASSRWGNQVAHPGNVDEGTQLNNSVKFTSADYNGFSFGGQYSFGNKPGKFSDGRVWTAAAGYQNGPLKFGAGYLEANQPNNTIWGDNSNGKTANHIGNADLTGVQQNTVLSGYASAGKLRIISAGANFEVGSALFGATYSNTQFKNLNDAAAGDLAETNPRGFTGSVTFHTAEASMDYKLTPALTAGISYSYTRGTNITKTSGAKYHQGNIGLKYALSKRTSVYTVASHQRASGTDSTALASRASIAGAGSSNTPRQTAVRVGINHRF